MHWVNKTKHCKETVQQDWCLNLIKNKTQPIGLMNKTVIHQQPVASLRLIKTQHRGRYQLH